ncbi:porin [Caballeronia sordidicola]|uniref:porin n=1 Tax=Caballeronia sordidicola TaxID=196367 RepID=UPI0004D0215E|nr:porin [Caballeronia sordidicola]
MKNFKAAVLPCVVLSTTIVPGVCHAQSSVTLYGVIDTAIGFVTNAGGTTSTNRVGFLNNNIQTSGWGVKGTEALGGDLSAIFNLQSSINPSTGSMSPSGVEFGHQAYVGLSSARYGTLTVGRQYDPVTELLGPLTADIYFGAFFATVGNVDNYDAVLRINNSIKYVSPTFAGLQFQAMAALNGIAGSVSAGGFYGLAASYTNGGFSVAGGYSISKVENTAALVNGAPSMTASTSADNLLYNNPVVQFEGITSNEIGRIGANYVFGSWIVGAAYSNSKFHQFGSNATLTFNSGSGFLHYAVNPALFLAAGYNYTKATGEGASASYNQVSLGADYLLSKRTDIYLSAVYQRASGNTLSNQDNLVPATASVSDEGFYGTSREQALAVVGIRHRF